MNEDAFRIDEGADDLQPEVGVPFRPPSPVWRIAVPLLVLAGLATAAEFGYRMYDQHSSPEVRPGGVALPGVVVSGSSIDFSFTVPDTFHSLHLSVSSDNGTEADADAARIGLIGTLVAREENGPRREWTAPIQLIASETHIKRRASIEDALQTTTTAPEGLVGLGVRYRIDYSLEPDPISPDELLEMRSLSHPAGTRLSFHLELDRPLQRNSRIYVSFARVPRLLHQALLRPTSAQLNISVDR